MADYTNVQDVKRYLPGPTSLQNSDDDTLIGELVTRLSRLFDRMTGHPPNYYASGTGVTRHYSGIGDAFLDIDEYESVTAVSQWIMPDQSDLVTMVPDDPHSQFYFTKQPVNGPPFTRLFTFNGWYPDVYASGNVAVTGDVLLAEPIQHAITVWAAHEYKGRAANWADMASRPDGPGYFYKKGIPAEVQIVIDQYTLTQDAAPGMALVDGSQGFEPGLYHWAGWRTFEVP